MLVPGVRQTRSTESSKTPTSSGSTARTCEHIAFGRGIHTCGRPAGPGRAHVTVNRCWPIVGTSRSDDVHHGSAGDRQYRYEPSLPAARSDPHITLSPPPTETGDP